MSDPTEAQLMAALELLKKISESPAFAEALAATTEKRYTFSAQLTAKQIIAVCTLLEDNL